LSMTPVSAQVPPNGRPSIGVQAYNACVTTDYASVAAKALNITSAQLRTDIVQGQTLQQIASGANVSYQTVADTIQAARKVDIDQAAKDGVITQTEATSLETPALPATQPANLPPPAGTASPQSNGAPPARPFGRQTGQLNQFPDISTINFLLQSANATPAVGTPGRPVAGQGFPRGGIGGLNNSLFDLVKPYAVAAQAVNLKCTDFVISLITPPGQSIPTVAATQKIDPQVVSDALTKAYQTALAQDVTDNIITQAQSDQLSATLNTAVAAFVNNPTPMQARPPAPATPSQG
jgi:hypothetical protein